MFAHKKKSLNCIQHFGNSHFSFISLFFTTLSDTQSFHSYVCKVQTTLIGKEIYILSKQVNFYNRTASYNPITTTTT
jgi:hypothetical protein